MNLLELSSILPCLHVLYLIKSRDIIKAFQQKTNQFHSTIRGLKITNYTSYISCAPSIFDFLDFLVF